MHNDGLAEVLKVRGEGGFRWGRVAGLFKQLPVGFEGNSLLLESLREPFFDQPLSRLPRSLNGQPLENSALLVHECLKARLC